MAAECNQFITASTSHFLGSEDNSITGFHKMLTFIVHIKLVIPPVEGVQLSHVV